MTISLDNVAVDLSCPKCGKKLKEKIGRLKRDQHVACPVCGRVAVDTSQLRRIEDGLNKELSKLGGKKLTIKL
ncbi:MAG: hypothetical protein AB1409_08095 [Pseudomonadota bacterium]